MGMQQFPALLRSWTHTSRSDEIGDVVPVCQWMSGLAEDSFVDSLYQLPHRDKPSQRARRGSVSSLAANTITPNQCPSRFARTK